MTHDTAALRFELFDPRWLADVDALLRDPEVLRFTRIPEPVPDGFLHDWLGGYETGRLDGSREGFVALGGDGGFLGLGLARLPGDRVPRATNSSLA